MHVISDYRTVSPHTEGRIEKLLKCVQEKCSAADTFDSRLNGRGALLPPVEPVCPLSLNLPNVLTGY